MICPAGRYLTTTASLIVSHLLAPGIACFHQGALTWQISYRVDVMDDDVSTCRAHDRYTRAMPRSKDIGIGLEALERVSDWAEQITERRGRTDEPKLLSRVYTAPSRHEEEKVTRERQREPSAEVVVRESIHLVKLNTACAAKGHATAVRADGDRAWRVVGMTDTSVYRSRTFFQTRRLRHGGVPADACSWHAAEQIGCAPKRVIL
jgi:hypothetical protein